MLEQEQANLFFNTIKNSTFIFYLEVNTPKNLYQLHQFIDQCIKVDRCYSYSRVCRTIINI